MPKPKEILAPSELNSSLLGKVAEGNDKPVTKMRIWERKLLDFSLRNSLLNFRVTKNTMQLMTADLGKLEDELASGSDFRISGQFPLVTQKYSLSRTKRTL